MLQTLLVKDYMIGDHLAFKPGTNVLDAIHQLLHHQLSGAPVVDADGQLLGFLSEKDCLRIAYSASYFDGRGGPVSDYMAHEVRTLSVDATLIDAIDLFLKHPHRCLPVVDGDLLVGQISRRDALRAIEKALR
ncbi:CBS domain-containing protein [Pseudothauera nasutitermitis]|uniref:CBS domain-containing protein n=1 Tax=Pseudothauera nasutitermitis TaxID=2565930 RepID=A0A4S4B4A1_9RHOO|nr:CBS domain-containing protein [Pseudothauera nasutitermitis]THF67479.1 CBS domain-containing protein [Pseudothauera nasutitermitis]